MAKSRDFVGAYDNIRSILRDMFFYGCYTVDDFSKRGISASKFNQEKRKLLGYLDSKHIKNQRIDGKTAMHFTTDMFDIAYNFLFDTFTMKSFVDSEVQLYILVLQVLSDKREFTQNQIADKIYQIINETDSTTLYRLLTKLVNNGYVKVNNRETPFTYTLAEDIFASLSEKEFISLMNAVDLLRNIVYPSVSGNLLFDTLNRYRKTNHITGQYDNPFLLKHSHFGQVLDDEVLWELTLAISDKKLISFSYQQKEVAEVLPVKIIVDEAYGRRYLFGVFIWDDNKPCLFRLDRINGLHINEAVMCDTESLEQIYDTQLKHSVTGASLLYDGNPKKVELFFKEDIAPFVKRRFPEAAYQTKNDGYIVEILVNDPVELKTWLRRFVGKITVLGSNEHNLAEDMENELLVWRSMYGDI